LGAAIVTCCGSQYHPRERMDQRCSLRVN
jgi:hypothetical protein